MPEEEKKEKKEDDKIILQVDMHCEGCKAKVRKALKEFKGVEGLDLDLKDQKVTIKGKLDARKVYETVKKKSGKRTVLLYPDLKEDEKQTEEPKKEEAPPDPESVVVLRVNMHCGACARQIKRSLLKMDGVNDVKEDVATSTVTVKGRNIDANKVCDRVKKRSGKHCEIVPPPPPPPPPPPKEEEKKEEKPAEEKKEEAKKDEEKPAEAAAPAEKKEEEKKEGGEEKGEEKKEEKKEEEKKEEKKDEADESKAEIKKYEYIPYRSVPEYIYPPQLFSDENPNACSIM